MAWGWEKGSSQWRVGQREGSEARVDVTAWLWSLKSSQEQKELGIARTGLARVNVAIKTSIFL